MTAAQILEIIIRAKDEATAKIAETTKKFQDMKDKIEEGSTAMALAGGAIVAALGFAVKAGADAEMQQIRLNAAIEGAGQAVNAARLTQLADQLQRITGIDADATVNAQALLATFKLTEDQIAALTPRLQNLSLMYGVDMTQAATQLGKAIQTGNTDVLKRWGVVIDESRFKAEGFSYLLQALDENTGPIAEKFGQTFPGAMSRFANTLGDVQEMVGQKLAPAIAAVAKKVEDVLNFLKDHPALVSIVAHLAAIAGGFLTVAGGAGLFLTKVVPAIEAGAKALLFLAGNPISLTIIGIGAIIAVCVALVRNWDHVAKGAEHALSFVKDYFSGLWDHIKQIASAIGNVFVTVWQVVKGEKHLSDLKEAFGQVKIKAQETAHYNAQVFGAAWDDIKAAGGRVFDAVKGYFAGTKEAATDTANHVKKQTQELTEEQKKQLEELRKARLDSALQWIEYEKTFNGMSEQAELDALNRVLSNYQLTTQEKIEIKKRANELEKKIADEAAADELKKLQESEHLAGLLRRQNVADRERIARDAAAEQVEIEKDLQATVSDIQFQNAEKRAAWLRRNSVEARQQIVKDAEEAARKEADAEKAAIEDEIRARERKDAYIRRNTAEQVLLIRRAAEQQKAAEEAAWKAVKDASADAFAKMAMGHGTLQDVLDAGWTKIKETTFKAIGDMVAKYVWGENVKQVATQATAVVIKGVGAVLAWLSNVNLTTILANMGAAMAAVFAAVGSTLAVLLSNPLTWILAGAVAIALANARSQWDAGKAQAEASVNNVPKFERGGPVTQTGLALVHAGEFVLPAPIVNMLAGAGAGGGDIYINVTGNHVYSPADETRLAQRVGQEIVRALDLRRKR